LQEDKDACIEAFRFFQRMQAGEQTETEDETRAVAAYYKVLNNMLSVFDLEKLYIPPQLDPKQGLYGNQILCEQALVEELALARPRRSHLLDMGCGRGRIAHRFATMTGGQVSGYNIDPDQIDNAVEWAAACDMSDRLHYKVGNHHEPLDYAAEAFDGCYSFQAVWPFFKEDELDAHAAEMFRVLKPGARYACSEYLLTPHFDWEKLRLGERGARDLAPVVPPDVGGHPVDVSGRCVRGAGTWRIRDPGLGPVQERGVADL